MTSDSRAWETAGAALLRSFALRARPRADNPRESAIEDNMFDLPEKSLRSQLAQRWTIGDSTDAGATKL